MQSVEVTQKPCFSPLLRHYTLQEFWALAEPKNRYHYDLIGGMLFMVPPPAPPHGTLDASLAASLHHYLKSNNIPGQVHHPREALYVDDEKGNLSRAGHDVRVNRAEPRDGPEAHLG